MGTSGRDQKSGLSKAFNTESGVFVHTNTPHIIGTYDGSKHPVDEGSIVPQRPEEENPRDPDAHLSHEQKQIRDDLEKSRHENPEEILAGRIAPLGTMVQHSLRRMEQKKSAFLRLITILIAQERINDAIEAAREFPLKIRGLGQEYRKKQEAAFDDLNDLIDKNNKAAQAITDQDFARDGQGNFANGDLNAYILIYLRHTDLPQDYLSGLSDEEARKFAEDAVAAHETTTQKISAYAEDLGTVAEIFERFDEDGSLSAALEDILADETLSDEQKLEALSKEIDPAMRELIKTLREADISAKVFNEALYDVEATGEVEKEVETPRLSENHYSF